MLLTAERTALRWLELGGHGAGEANARGASGERSPIGISVEAATMYFVFLSVFLPFSYYILHPTTSCSLAWKTHSPLPPQHHDGRASVTNRHAQSSANQTTNRIPSRNPRRQPERAGRHPIAGRKKRRDNRPASRESVTQKKPQQPFRLSAMMDSTDRRLPSHPAPPSHMTSRSR